MLKLLASRFLQGLLTLFVLITITFFLVRMMPGSPYTEEKAIPAHILERMKAYTGMDKPLPVVLYDSKFWNTAINFEIFLKSGLIHPKDFSLFGFSDSPDHAWSELIARGLNISQEQ